ncbi:hypothetical protein G1C96_1584 [Bifidobacterium sp. DSM 109958]|uniref:DUF3566 domain-containing protein n=1 Tax=Bifidobacterium moraviense TaxID=2675323 RepID=A0A7Y0F2V2_9BIFI|nr:DUF3566 domain-containing protein [Bifidobacterium sp. DSM 109958]NMN01002.1 hypothetical protein [Bifidobacterium sp. DSM 109958]
MSDNLNEPAEHAAAHEGREARSAASHRMAYGASEPVSAAASPAAPAQARARRVPRARRMKLSLTHVDPWSVAKVSFLLAIAGAIIQIVAVALIWGLLNVIGLFDSVNDMVSNTGLSGLDLNNILSLPTVLSATTILSIFEVVLIMVLATIGAFLYNVVCALVGGIHVTLGDD